MRSVSTSVSQCWDTFRLAWQGKSRMCQCVQTTVMLGLTHARMIGPVLRTGWMTLISLKMGTIVVQIIQPVPRSVSGMGMEKGSAVGCGERHSSTPPTWITAQWWPSTIPYQILTTGLRSHALTSQWLLQPQRVTSLHPAARQLWCTGLYCQCH